MKHICPHCGAELPDRASFCPHCASSLQTRQSMEAPAFLRRRSLLPVLAALLVLAVALVLWGCLQPKGLPKGPTEAVILQEDENGQCIVSAEVLQTWFPEVTAMNFGTTSITSDNIDDYLVDNFQMAALVSSQGTEGSGTERNMFNARSNGSSRHCLLLFDTNLHLMGYFIGQPENLGDGQWQFDVTLCDYDFTTLYEKELSSFDAEWESLFSNYIAPEDIASSGAVWYLKGYNTGKTSTLRQSDAQLYHLWTVYNSPTRENQCRELERLEQDLPDEGRWMCYLLLDGNNELVGYTMLDTNGNGGEPS